MKKPIIKIRHSTPESFRAILKNSSEKFGDKVVYKYFKSNNELAEMTYKQLYSTYKNVGSALCSMGLQKTKIAVIGENRPEWMISYFAVVGCGSVIVPLDKELLTEQIEAFIALADIEAIFCSSKYVDSILAMDLPKLKYVIDFDDSGKNDSKYISYSKLVSTGSKLLSDGYTKFKQTKYDSSKMCVLLFTSGTTGTSKGVMLSEENILEAVNASSNMIAFNEKEVLMSVLPMHHTYENTCGQITAIRLGVTICINNSLKYLMRNFKLFRPTAMIVVPLYITTIQKRILDEIKRRNKQKTVDIGIKATRALKKVGLDARSLVFSEIVSSLGGRLKEIICGGAAADPEIIKWFSDIGINVSQGYGITECSPLVAANPLVTVHAESVGLPIPNSRVKIVSDEKGIEYDVPPGEIGEICVKGKHVMLGYYNNEEATASAFNEEGYFRTGDYGYLDEDGFLYITGRKKNIIVLNNGKNVYPEEIEEYLERIEIIKEVVVIGRTKDDGEVVLTALVYPDYDLFVGADNNEIITAVRTEVGKINKILPSFKQIRNIEIRKNEFEKTTTKKIIRYKLS